MFATQKKYASQSLSAVLAGQTLTEALSELWKAMPDLRPQQRGAIQDLSYGTLRHFGLLDNTLKLLLNKPVHEPALKALLLVCLYQLQFTRAAPYSVVDHAVKVASHTGSGQGKGLVNAILRNFFLRRRDTILNEARHNDYGKWSHPQWWVNAMREAWPEHWESILNAGNQHPPLTLRVNRHRSSVEQYMALLAEASLEATVTGKDAIRLRYPVGVDRLPGFFDGLVSVQDLGAQYAAQLLDVHDGMRVLDACSAPGGKTGHLLETATLDLTAVDSDAQRLTRVGDNLQRLGLSAKLVRGDASRPKEWWDARRLIACWPTCRARPVAWHAVIRISNGCGGRKILSSLRNNKP